MGSWPDTDIDPNVCGDIVDFKLEPPSFSVTFFPFRPFG